MDKNTLTGILLIGAIFIAFLILNNEQQQPVDNSDKKEKAEVESGAESEDSLSDIITTDSLLNNSSLVESLSTENQLSDPLLDDSAAILLKEKIELAQKKDQYGIFYTALNEDSSHYQLENDKIRVQFSSKGGRITEVFLVEKKENGNYKYTTHADYVAGKNNPLKLFEEESSGQSISFTNEADDVDLNTNDFYFKKEELTENTLVLSLVSDDGTKKIKFIYELKKGNYHVDYSIKYENLTSNYVKDVEMNWYMKGLSTEKLASDERMICTTMFRYLGEGRDYLYENRDESGEIEAGKLNWIAYKQKFFSSVLIYDDGFTAGNFSQKQLTDDNYTIFYNSNMSLPENNDVKLKFFFGPNDAKVLASYDNEMEGLINLGWGIFRWVNQILIEPIFNLLKSTGLSFGLIILLVTLIVKLIILPLTYKNYKSTAKMKVLKPEIEKINKKYEGKTDKDVMMKKQKETMGLYKQTGVNPMAGCIPMLIQMPILLAVFKFFPSSIDLRHEGFLWAEDLSSYDSILDLGFNIPMYGDHVSLFTLLMAASTFAYTMMNSSQMTSSPGMPNMKIIMYIFPFMMLFFLNSFSSGLTYYYFCGNMMNLGIMWSIKKYMIDENKIRLQIEENKKKPKKKSKFQQRMEDMAKQQQKRRK
jgi:YidC/Oxa1 family membrane protein insertase